jgi:hypothetical protein
MCGPMFGAKNPEPGVEAQIILTVADHMNHKPTALKAEDVDIIDATIADVRALSGDLELYLLIDDAANYDFGSKLRDLRRFVNQQPAATAIGLAYIHDGSLQVAENPTTDRQKLIGGLRAPSGSKAANPYCALSDLIDGWKKQTLRREVVLISTGIDETATDGAICVNAETTIRDAERAGIQIFGLYNPIPNYLSADWGKVDSGVTDLAHVCYETGGEAYFQGHDALDTIEPYLTDIAEHLAHQYLVRFRMNANPDSGLRPVFVLSAPGSRSPELMVPESVWVAAHK